MCKLYDMISGSGTCQLMLDVWVGLFIFSPTIFCVLNEGLNVYLELCNPGGCTAIFDHVPIFPTHGKECGTDMFAKKNQFHGLFNGCINPSDKIDMLWP